MWELTKNGKVVGKFTSCEDGKNFAEALLAFYKKRGDAKLTVVNRYKK